jgi:hypothetical protein
VCLPKIAYLEKMLRDVVAVLVMVLLAWDVARMLLAGK